MIFQDPYASLNPRWRVFDIIAEPLRAHGIISDKQGLKGRITELLEQVSLSSADSEKFPHEFSGGQRQRISIARALAMSPEVILFDEPTSALDPERVGEVLTVMKNLSSEGYTMIVVTHEMEFARAVSDQVVFLEKGLLIEKSAPEKFFTNPETERVRKFLELSA